MLGPEASAVPTRLLPEASESPKENKPSGEDAQSDANFGVAVLLPSSPHQLLHQQDHNNRSNVSIAPAPAQGDTCGHTRTAGSDFLTPDKFQPASEGAAGGAAMAPSNGLPEIATPALPIATNATPLHKAAHQARNAAQRFSTAGIAAPLCRKRLRELPLNASVEAACDAIWELQAHSLTVNTCMDQRAADCPLGEMNSCIHTEPAGSKQDLTSDEVLRSSQKCKVTF